MNDRERCLPLAKILVCLSHLEPRGQVQYVQTRKKWIETCWGLYSPSNTFFVAFDLNTIALRPFESWRFSKPASRISVDGDVNSQKPEQC